MSGFFHCMNVCRPPDLCISLSPGAIFKWYVLQMSACEPTVSTSSCESVRTVARVATGMNAGVSISPCGVEITPRRARDLPDNFKIFSNLRDAMGIAYVFRLYTAMWRRYVIYRYHNRYGSQIGTA